MQQLEKVYAEKTIELNKIENEREVIRDLLIAEMQKLGKTQDKTEWGYFTLQELKHWTFSNEVREMQRSLFEKKKEEKRESKASYTTQPILILKPFIQRDWNYYKRVYTQRYRNRPEGVPTAH